MAWTSEKSWSGRRRGPTRESGSANLALGLLTTLLFALGGCAGPMGPYGSALEARETPAPSENLPDPTDANRVFVVAEGETLSRIAAWLGVSVRELVALNDLADPDLLEVGQELLVPWQVPDDRLPIRGPRERVPPVAAASPSPAPPVSEPVPVEAPPSDEARDPFLRQLRTDLELARLAYHEADFLGALSLTQYLSAAAGAMPSQPTARRLHADASFLSGAIRVGLGDEANARCDFGRALSIADDYEPDLSEVSPKVVAVFETVKDRDPEADVDCGSEPPVHPSNPVLRLSESVEMPDPSQSSDDGRGFQTKSAPPAR